MENRNIACRIFKEQIDLVLQLPESERAEVLYKAILSVFNQIENQNENQFDNQIENQNEYAYVSVSDSVSVLSKTVFSLLKKNIVCKEFSNNYGGRRINAGRPNSAQTGQSGQKAIQTQTETETENKNINNNINISTTRAKENQIENQTANQNEKRVHNALEIFGNSFRAVDAVVGVFDRPDGTTREGIQIKNPRLMAFIRQRFDRATLDKVSDWAIDHNQRGHTYNASALIKLLCKFQTDIEPAINYNAVQAQYLTFEPAQRKEA